MEIIIKGNPITKKNHSQIITIKGRHILIPSKQYKEYEKLFRLSCIEAKAYNKKINYPVEVKCLYYMKTRRKVDLSNLLNGTDDALIAAGIIEDDNCSIIVSHDGSRVYYDKDNPRVEITITKVEGTFPDLKKTD